MTESLNQIGFGILTNKMFSTNINTGKNCAWMLSFRMRRENLETKEHARARVMTVQDIPSWSQAPLGGPLKCSWGNANKERI